MLPADDCMERLELIPRVETLIPADDCMEGLEPSDIREPVLTSLHHLLLVWVARVEIHACLCRNLVASS